MTVSDILNELSRRDIDIEVVGEKIRLHGSSEDALDESLVGLIRDHKAEIVKLLSSEAGLKGRPIWCNDCPHGGYKTSEEDTKALWCNLANQTVLDMQKCVKGYWVKNKRGFPVTVH